MANDVVANGTGGASGLTDNEKMMSAAGYVIICCALPLFLVPMFAAKESRFAQFHARQGAALYAVTIVGVIVLSILQFVITSVIRSSIVSCLTSIPILLVLGVGFVLMIIGIINAMQGQMKPLPVLAPVAEKLPF